MQRLFTFIIISLLSFSFGCTTYKVTSEPDGALIQYQNKFNTTTMTAFSYHNKQRTPCSGIVGQSCGPSAEHVSVKWPDGTESKWKSLQGHIHFKKSEYLKKIITRKITDTPYRMRKGRLYVEVSPKNAQVKILNKNIRYVPGVDLSPGRYWIQVSKNGYETKKREIRICEFKDRREYVGLAPLHTSSTAKFRKPSQPSPAKPTRATQKPSATSKVLVQKSANDRFNSISEVEKRIVGQWSMTAFNGKQWTYTFNSNGDFWEKDHFGSYVNGTWTADRKYIYLDVISNRGHRAKIKLSYRFLGKHKLNIDRHTFEGVSILLE